MILCDFVQVVMLSCNLYITSLSDWLWLSANDKLKVILADAWDLVGAECELAVFLRAAIAGIHLSASLSLGLFIIAALKVWLIANTSFCTACTFLIFCHKPCKSTRKVCMISPPVPHANLHTVRWAAEKYNPFAGLILWKDFWLKCIWFSQNHTFVLAHTLVHCLQ